MNKMTTGIHFLLNICSGIIKNKIFFLFCISIISVQGNCQLIYGGAGTGSNFTIRLDKTESKMIPFLYFQAKAGFFTNREYPSIGRIDTYFNFYRQNNESIPVYLEQSSYFSSKTYTSVPVNTKGFESGLKIDFDFTLSKNENFLIYFGFGIHICRMKFTYTIPGNYTMIIPQPDENSDYIIKNMPGLSLFPGIMYKLNTALISLEFGGKSYYIKDGNIGFDSFKSAQYYVNLGVGFFINKTPVE